MDPREAKAHQIAATTKLEQQRGRWRVPSQSGGGSYDVYLAVDGWRCTCADFAERLADCKHIIAVLITVQRERAALPREYAEDPPVTTYSQDWPRYNASQVAEREAFRRLVNELCSLVPPRQRGTGRPRLELGDVTASLLLTTYARKASRRASGEVAEMLRDGLIGKAPSFNSRLRYQRSEELTAVLMSLVTASALPLSDLDTDRVWAVDSTGFGVSNQVAWFDRKYGREQTRHGYVKLHACVGTATNIVAAAIVTGQNANDSPYFVPLIEEVQDHFRMSEVSADKAYSSKANAAAVEMVGGTPYISFKSTVVRPDPGTAWARMWHAFEFEREQFLEHYHQRSNAETTFAMIKRRFGAGLLAKTMQGQINEVLCKVIAHNLCVLNVVQHELGLAPSPTSHASAFSHQNVISLDGYRDR